jgi:hypothetical protein
MSWLKGNQLMVRVHVAVLRTVNPSTGPEVLVLPTDTGYVLPGGYVDTNQHDRLEMAARSFLIHDGIRPTDSEFVGTTRYGIQADRTYAVLFTSGVPPEEGVYLPLRTLDSHLARQQAPFAEMLRRHVMKIGMSTPERFAQCAKPL